MVREKNNVRRICHADANSEKDSFPFTMSQFNLNDVQFLLQRVADLELAEKELAERKAKRAVIQKRYRQKHAAELKQKKAACYQAHKKEYAEAARRRRAKYAAQHGMVWYGRFL